MRRIIYFLLIVCFSSCIEETTGMLSSGETGVVTAGHFISKDEILGISSNSKKEEIGKCLVSSAYDGLVDAAFCEITSSSYTPSNRIEFMANPDIDTLSVEVRTPGIHRMINMVGFKSKRVSGIVYRDNYDLKYNEKVLLRDVMLMTCVPDYGDSGGIVYALNTQDNIRYTMGIISGFCELQNPLTGDSKFYGICCKASVINRNFGLERY